MSSIFDAITSDPLIGVTALICVGVVAYLVSELLGSLGKKRRQNARAQQRQIDRED